MVGRIKGNNSRISPLKILQLMGYLIKSSSGGWAWLQQEHRVSRGRQVILSRDIVIYV